ncbi:hypothetical protein WICMUC_002532 [Wickerhamomyces mucosus]|uniref:Altered inheritance of mitochondria protein 21 n=1 Tax=Wickerhamomyces mucosus TaxID=1378264 RepID=A0A9P8TEK9_9ASCO|nr:hypothetical protein WICMUC_002532 [Wickerhamomyces mucosus]
MSLNNIISKHKEIESDANSEFDDEFDDDTPSIPVIPSRPIKNPIIQTKPVNSLNHSNDTLPKIPSRPLKRAVTDQSFANDQGIPSIPERPKRATTDIPIIPQRPKREEGNKLQKLENSEKDKHNDNIKVYVDGESDEKPIKTEVDESQQSKVNDISSTTKGDIKESSIYETEVDVSDNTNTQLEQKEKEEEKEKEEKEDDDDEEEEEGNEKGNERNDDNSTLRETPPIPKRPLKKSNELSPEVEANEDYENVNNSQASDLTVSPDEEQDSSIFHNSAEKEEITGDQQTAPTIPIALQQPIKISTSSSEPNPTKNSDEYLSNELLTSHEDVESDKTNKTSELESVIPNIPRRPTKKSSQVEDSNPVETPYIPARPSKPLSQNRTTDIGKDLAALKSSSPTGQGLNSNERVPPPKPKKPSSKILAFQEMLRKNQEAASKSDQGPIPSKGKETSTNRTAFKNSLNGLFALPGLAQPGSLPKAYRAETEDKSTNDGQSEKEKTKEDEEELQDVRKSRARAPRGRRLPKAATETLIVEDKRTIKVFNIFSSGKFEDQVEGGLKLAKDIRGENSDQAKDIGRIESDESIEKNLLVEGNDSKEEDNDSLPEDQGDTKTEQEFEPVSDSKYEDVEELTDTISKVALENKVHDDDGDDNASAVKEFEVEDSHADEKDEYETVPIKDSAETLTDIEESSKLLEIEADASIAQEETNE